MKFGRKSITNNGIEIVFRTLKNANAWRRSKLLGASQLGFSTYLRRNKITKENYQRNQDKNKVVKIRESTTWNNCPS